MKQWERLQKKMLKNQALAKKAYQLMPAYREQVIVHMQEMEKEFGETEKMVNDLLLKPIREILRKIPWNLTKDRLPMPDLEIWYEVTVPSSPVPFPARFTKEYDYRGSFYTWGGHEYHPSHVIAWRPLMSEIYHEL